MNIYRIRRTLIKKNVEVQRHRTFPRYSLRRIKASVSPYLTLLSAGQSICVCLRTYMPRTKHVLPYSSASIINGPRRRHISLLRTTVVRSLAGNSHIVRMAFQYTGIGDTGKLGVVQLHDVVRTAISHART